MNLCSSGHDEVCHEGRNCPACEAIAEMNALQKEKDELQDQVDELKDELETMMQGKGSNQ